MQLPLPPQPLGLGLLRRGGGGVTLIMALDLRPLRGLDQGGLLLARRHGPRMDPPPLAHILASVFTSRSLVRPLQSRPPVRRRRAYPHRVLRLLEVVEGVARVA